MNIFLSPRENFTAGQGEGGVLLVAAGHFQKRRLFNAVNNGANIGPVNGAGAHSARLNGGVQGAVPEKLTTVLMGGLGRKGAFRMAGADMLCDFNVALLFQNISVRIHQKRAERRIPGITGLLCNFSSSQQLKGMIFH